MVILKLSDSSFLAIITILSILRSIAVHQSGIGKPCIGAKVTTKRCTPDCVKPPEDCKISEWTSWSECTAACGGGQRYRTRSVLSEAKHQGKTCDYPMKETEPCNDQICSAPVDCKVGAWDKWSACTATCGGGQQYRHRHIEVLVCID